MTTSPRPPLAEQLDLAPHPEGGWFRETWRSDHAFEPEGYGGPRRAATAIYFLLHPGEESRWHVVRSDELWLWHAGGPLALRMRGLAASRSLREPEVTAAGSIQDQETAILGNDIAAGQRPQVLVPGGVWQAAAPAGDQPVLVSCVVAPGFDFADFRMD
ncbi:cupin domain-containing protein [Phytohabitans sp. ZYX-F-186]|uniref:Cupin domain-containing protein n=1 Tax=Phytohabitans maris TaxID=3071409 RepID=A0ABU0ZHF6_9ACTN|nr:cupin domain-containing protein [Phytohabitans sp. ZYX-F-186]MDQ7906493.1 cupin domain-containing protein [Phytohabitans sp. ZYX-F-186]